MKKIMFLVLLLIPVIYTSADEKKSFDSQEICIGGLTFAVVQSDSGISITQIFIAVNNKGYIPQPKPCKADKK